VEGKGLIPPNQTGLRKGMGTLDIYTLIYIIIIYIYTLNYLINRQIGKGGKMTAMFVNLRAAFDSVEEIRSMREREIREELMERVEEMLRKARSSSHLKRDWHVKK